MSGSGTDTVTKITVTPSATVVPCGGTREFATDIPKDSPAEWSVKVGSSLPEGTFFDGATGRITAGMTPGNFILHVASISASADVFVSVEEFTAKGVALSQNRMNLFGSEAGKLTAFVNPSSASNKKILWNIEGTSSVETVISDDELTFSYRGGALTEPLTFDVKATVSGDAKLSAVCTVTVNPAPAKIISFNSMTISAKTHSMFTAEEAAITAQISPADATGTLTWESSSKDIAVLTSDGTKAAVKTMGKAGKTVITATFTYPNSTPDAPPISVVRSCDITVTDAKAPKGPSVTAAERVTLENLGIALPISAPGTAYGDVVSDDIAIINNPAASDNIIKLLEPTDDGTRKLIKSEVAAAYTVSYENITALPVIATDYGKKEGEKEKTVILTINVSGITFPRKALKIADLTYLKLRRDTLTYDSLPRVERAEDLTDGKWLIRGADGSVLTGESDILRSTKY
ncbi:MAG: hypothetical protein RR214_05270, partial [Synergistaceae bacterium]